LEPKDWENLEILESDKVKQLVLTPSFMYMRTDAYNLIKLNKTSGEYINGMYI